MIFKGSCTALVTPFSDDGKAINFNAFKNLIDEQIQNGTNALLFLGTTGEPATMSVEEKDSVVKFAVDYVNKRVPVIVGSGSNSTFLAIEQSKRYEKFGVDALLVVTPYYNKCTQWGLEQHYTEIANSVKIPIIMYNVPSRTGVNLLPQTVEKLSRVSNIVAVKEASGNLDQIIEIIRICPQKFSVYSGDDGLILPILSIGGMGVISVASNVIPKTISMLCKSFFNGELLTCQKIQLAITPFVKSLFCEVNPIPVKKALNVRNKEVGALRLPLTEMQTKSEVLENFKELF